MLIGLRIIHFDVSQGESTLVSVLEHGGNSFHVLIDGGRKCRGKYVVRCLEKLGVSKIAYAICTHLDNDHHEGLVPVIECKNISVGALLVPKIDFFRDDFLPLKNACSTHESKFGTPKVGSKLYNNYGCSITIVHVGKPTIRDDNPASIGILVRLNEFSYYAAGDLPSEDEDELELPKHVCAFKCGHHGAKTSTSRSFVKAISPTVAIISAGRHRHGHPHQDLLDRLTDSKYVQRFFATNCMYVRKGFKFGKGVACSAREQGILGHVVVYADSVSSKAHGDGTPDFFTVVPPKLGTAWPYYRHWCGMKGDLAPFKFLRLKASELPEHRLEELSESYKKLKLLQLSKHKPKKSSDLEEKSEKEDMDMDMEQSPFSFSQYYKSDELRKIKYKESLGTGSPIHNYLDDTPNFFQIEEETSKKKKEVIKFEYEHASGDKLKHCPGCDSTEKEDDGKLVQCSHGINWFVCNDCSEEYQTDFDCED